MLSPFELLSRHVNVSHETFERLSLYHDLLLKWQLKINLVSNDTISNSWERHFLDSIQLLPYIDLNKKIADLGSGAGFPGMVLAICGAKNMHLVESDARKISFLQEVARITKTTVNLHLKRIEEANEIGKVDIIVSRALSDLNQLLNFSSHFVSHETICLFHKGKNADTEIKDAKKFWSFDHQKMPSITSNEGVIVKLSTIRRERHDKH